MRRLGGIAGAAAALAIPLLPKCPACLLPLVAAAGVALPRGPVVEAAIVTAAAGGPNHSVTNLEAASRPFT